MRVLISGAGIAGATLAYRLARYGFTPTIVEKAPKLRTSGYIIDFWGLGFDVADRMTLLPEIKRKGYKVREVNWRHRSAASSITAWKRFSAIASPESSKPGAASA